MARVQQELPLGAAPARSPKPIKLSGNKRKIRTKDPTFQAACNKAFHSNLSLEDKLLVIIYALQYDQNKWRHIYTRLRYFYLIAIGRRKQFWKEFDLDKVFDDYFALYPDDDEAKLYEELRVKDRKSVV
jgi:hypothetical protein